MKILLRFLVNAAALAAAAFLVPGITTGGIGSVLAMALVFGLVNVFIRPIVKILSLPVTILTLGLFSLVVNALLLLFAAWLGKGFGIDFRVNGFLAAFVGALIVSIVSTILGWFVKDE